MFRKFFALFLFYILLLPNFAQAQNMDLRNTILGIHAFPYLNFPYDATDIVLQAIQNKSENSHNSIPVLQYDFYEKTSIDFVANKYAIEQQLQVKKETNDFIFRNIIAPFEPWLNYAKIAQNPNELDLTTFVTEDYKKIYTDNLRKKNGSVFLASRNVGLYESIGKQNIMDILDEAFGDIDLYKDENEMMLFSFKSPLGTKAAQIYKYRLLGKKLIEEDDCYEIAFYSENLKENTFAGYLYITADGKYALTKAVFTLNDPNSMNFIKELLIVHTYKKESSYYLPEKKVNTILLGHEIKGSLMVERTSAYTNYDFSAITDNKLWRDKHEKGYMNRDSAYWSNVRPIPLSLSQKQIEHLVEDASLNSVFINFQNALLILLNNHIPIGGIDGPVELGPITQLFSYNDMEGFRIKLGGNTMLSLNERLMLGGYVAYGTEDGRFKYRGDLTYSFLPRRKFMWDFPKRLLTLTYVDDLNIPGEDLLNSNRDNIAYSFSQTSTNNMSLQKIGQITFENENKHNFSYKFGGKYTFDKPMGVVKYMKASNGDTTTIDDISTAELSLSLRLSPNEQFFQNREKRVPIRRGDVELKLNHRVGIKGVFGSDYSYQITDFSAYKKFNLGNHIGNLDTRVYAGKVWNRVPFPLLFIPMGNQSYLYQQEKYNCMNFYEFTTDNFVSGNVDFMFNWSPFKLFMPKNKIKLSMGGRAIYGPLSDNNNPDLHSELFIFNQGVKPLGNQPYVEVNIGLANVLKFLRIEYIRRLTYLDNDDSDGGHSIKRGTILFAGSFAF